MTASPRSSEARLPQRINDLDAAWLSEALGVAVTSVDVRHVIPGTATKVMLDVTYADAAASDGPPTAVCVKGGLDPRLLGRAVTGVLRRFKASEKIQAYKLEADFYQHFRLGGMGLPRCWFAGSDASGQGIIVMDDLETAGVKFGAPTQAWSVDDVAAALEVLARLHAGTWGINPRELTWLPEHPVVAGLTKFLMNPAYWRWQMRADAGTVPTEFQDRRTVRDALDSMWHQHRAEATCLTHGDAHLGNTYVDTTGNPFFLDWQGVCYGPPLDDVAYFVTGALTTADRRTSERDLLAHYTRALAGHGGPELSADQAWDGYRRYALHGFLWRMTPTIMQSAENVRAMSERHLAAVDDLETLEAIRRWEA